jgi:molecular chaperone HtpG
MAMCPRFQHTLSRDNVRRDEAFREALARAREASRGLLRREIRDRLAPAAATAAELREVSRYLALVEAALTPPTRIDPEEIPFPLAHPIAGRSAAAGLGSMLTWRAPLLTAERSEAVGEALAARGVPAVLLAHPDLRGMLQRCYPKLRLVAARDAYLIMSPVQGKLGDGGAALQEALPEALARARHEVARVAFCRVEGALGRRAGLLLPEGEEGPRLAAAVDVERRGARWRPTDTLHLNLRATTVALARRAAAGDPHLAAAILARALILEAGGPLDPGDADLLLDLGRAGRAGAHAPRRPA